MAQETYPERTEAEGNPRLVQLRCFGPGSVQLGGKGWIMLYYPIYYVMLSYVFNYYHILLYIILHYLIYLILVYIYYAKKPKFQIHENC